MPSFNRRSFLCTRNGFSLIEVVLSLFVTLALITILLTATATLRTSRNSNLQVTATQIASRQIENLRNTAYGSLPTGTTPFSDANLTKLPNSTATQTFSDYGTKIKQVTLQVSWQESGINKNIKIDTLIYENGI